MTYQTPMKRSIRLSAVVLSAAFATGCGMMQTPGGVAIGQPAHAGSSQSVQKQPAVVIPKESKDLIRKGEQDAYARADEAEDESLDKMEKETLTAVRVTLGKEKYAESQPAPMPASEIIAALRKQKVKMRLEPVVNGHGQANDDFLQLKDEPTDRLQMLGRKSAEGTATAAEKREMMAYQKIAFKLMDLRMQVLKVSVSTVGVNSHVQMSGVQSMLRVSQMVRSRKLYDMELDASDYALVKRGLERQRRAEAIAAVTLAMLGAYQAVINDNAGDPKALDVIGEGTLKAFPLKPTVTDEEARAYVASLGANVAKVKAGYEASMRKTWGDAKYEKSFKAQTDAMFSQAESAQTQKSVQQLAQQTNDKYVVDVGKCMRGEAVDPGSMVGGGTCNSLKRAAASGDTTDLPPGALAAYQKNGGAVAPAGGTGGGSGVPRNAKNGMALAGAAANGDVDGALESGAQMFGPNSHVGASLQGIAALKKGDARGAISSALTFVPVPGLKDAFGFASKLLFKG